MEINTKADRLIEFYLNNPEVFERRVNKLKRYSCYILVAACSILIFFPDIIPLGAWLVRTAAIAGLIYFGFEIYLGGIEIYNKISNGMITKLLIKKFDMSECNESKLVEAFNNKNFDALNDAPGADDQPIQLYVEEDKTGKELYCVMMKYYSSSDFRSATDIIVLSGSDYDKWIGVFKSMK